MTQRPVGISNISGNMITLVIDPDVEMETVYDGPTDEPEDETRTYEEELSTISFNGLIEKCLGDQDSEIGREMREFLSKGEPIPKKLIYTALKRALDTLDPTKPVLIVDRRLNFNIENSANSGPLVEKKENGHSMGNGIAVIGLPNEHGSKNGLPARPAEEIDQKASLTKRALKMMKNAFCPADEPIPTPKSEEGEEKPHFIIRYSKKMKGGQKRPPYDRPLEALLSLIVSFVGILALTAIDYFLLADTDYTLVIGSFGATAVLIFCALKSPLAQPRNVLGGHVLAAVIGVGFQLLLGKTYPWLAAALAVSISIAVMSLTNTVHPPAGATALIAVYSNDKIHNLGFMYILVPVLAGAAILLLVAVIMNNLFPSRRYPVHWF